MVNTNHWRYLMISIEKLSDYNHPLVISKADELTREKKSQLEKVKSIFYFIRDDIQFGFPPTWDTVKASETLSQGLGYCNTKATLFKALCKVADIPCRIHTALIDIRIMRGIIPKMVFPFLPDKGSHSWIEVKIDDKWNSIDSYINDRRLYDGALKKLARSGMTTAFSISRSDGNSSCAFNFGEQGYVHMGAVSDDHGIWDDFSEYMQTKDYQGLDTIQRFFFPILAWQMNRNVQKLRT